MLPWPKAATGTGESTALPEGVTQVAECPHTRMTPTPQDSIIDLPISTTFDLPGFTVERTLGLSWGLIVRSVGTVKGISGGLRALRAGEVPRYTEVVNAARRTALERLVEHARELGGRDRGRVRPGLGGSGVQPRAG